MMCWENGLTVSVVTTCIGGNAAVSALLPDQIPSGADERARLNLPGRLSR